jgi:hypothetical protein
MDMLELIKVIQKQKGGDYLETVMMKCNTFFYCNIFTANF